MRALRAVYHTMRADLLERTRRPTHLLFPALMLFLVYWANHGNVTMHVEHYRGLFNSAWCGTLLSFWGVFVLSLAGFYVVKSAVLRDRQTRTGELLAATPVSRFVYLVGKGLSNAGVLAGPAAILILGAVALQLLRGESPRLEAWPLVSPFLLLCLPVIFLVAATALTFECLPVLSGGVGNIAYFFLWVFVLDRTSSTHNLRWDVLGTEAMQRSVVASAHAQFPAISAHAWLSVQASPSVWMSAQHFAWPGIAWTPNLVLPRLLWVGLGLAMLAVASVCFDRFDPARAPRLRVGLLAQLAARLERLRIPWPQLPALSFENRLAALLAAELRLLLRGHRPWWYLGALTIFIVSLCVPLANARTVVLPIAWIWPVLAWSAMGTREQRWGTAELVFSAPHSQRRQFPALYLAGVLVAVVLGGGVALRLGLAGDTAGLLAWAIGALLIPAAALGLGVCSGTPRSFEALYTIAWYIGPLQHVAALDFMGTSPHRTGQYLPWYAALTVVSLGLAYVGRQRQAAR